ncbi:MAG TPA: class I SAM-dependent methyltransferase [Bacteroidales bacterium]|nr:class I SAM-dependent methyltransferase [Bacteroidales bacterium]
MSNLPHDNWAEYYDCVYERTYGPHYNSFNITSIDAVNELLSPGVNSILDYGAGTGRLSIPLAQAGNDVLAVEQSLPMLNVLIKKATALNLTIQTEGCNIQGYDGRSADFALCVFTVLNYTTEDSELVKIFSNIHKHLKDKGLFFFDLADLVFFKMGTIFDINKNDFTRHVVITPDHDNLYTYTEHCQGICNGNKFEYDDAFPLRYWSHAEVDRMLHAAGFNRVNRAFPEFSSTGSTYYLYQKI